MKRFASVAIAIGLTTVALGACSQQPGSSSNSSGGVNTSETAKCPEGSMTAQKPAPGSQGAGTYVPPAATPGTPANGRSGAATTGNATC